MARSFVILLFGAKIFIGKIPYLSQEHSQAKSLFGKKQFTDEISCVIDGNLSELFHYNQN
jgi:hypothetical protein